MTLKDKATSVAQTLIDRGYTAFLVGGCVRDILLKREPKDYDIATSATPPQIQEVFPHNYAVGESFGCIKVNDDGNIFDVTTYRSEANYTDGRRPDTVIFETDPRQDVLRRDFTINGLLMDVQGNVIDYVDGLRDIESRTVRAIGNAHDRFTEDALRIMRAVRFVVQLGFIVSQDTFAAAKDTIAGLENISMERRRDEFRKILESEEPEIGLMLLRTCGALGYILPELLLLDGVEQPSKYHKHDVGTHVHAMIVHAEKPMSFELAMSILLHDIAKPQCKGLKPDGTIHFHNHEHVGKEMALNICERLHLTNDQRFIIGEFVHKHMRPHSALEMKPATLKRLCRVPRFEEFLELHRLDCLCSNENMETYVFLKKFYEEHKHEINVVPLITGYHLLAMGFKQGPIFKEILDAVETRQLNGELATTGQAVDFVNSYKKEIASEAKLGVV